MCLTFAFSNIASEKCFVFVAMKQNTDNIALKVQTSRYKGSGGKVKILSS